MDKMQKPKKVRKKLEYWQIGGIIGLIIGIIAYFITLYFVNVLRYEEIMGIFYGLPFEIYYNLFKNLNLCPCGNKALGFALLTAPIYYGIIGALIGLIIGKVKKK